MSGSIKKARSIPNGSPKHNKMTILYYVYAALLLLGGLIGFLRARSGVSLGASAVAAILVAAASLLLPHHPRFGSGIGSLIALIIAMFFFGRYHATKKPMPALPVIVVSVLVLLASLLRLVGVKF
jgi:uncharacterized membrane protein (UPF0136 family)